MRIIKFIIFLILLFQFGCNESFDSSYADYREVILDKAIFRGWIPEELPQSAIEIYEFHDLDSNVGCGSFLYKKEEGDIFLQKLNIVDNKIILKFRCFNSRDEWHSSRIIKDVNNLLNQGYKIYKTNKFYFAVNEEFCRAYFWNIYSVN